MSQQCYSDIECKIIKAQIERRAKFRQEFLKLRTDPCKHATEAGYVFDPALQRFLSMKSCQAQYFKPSIRTVISGILNIAPFFIYGYVIWYERNQFLRACECGKIKYRDRTHKF
ncbi:unnamed protein product [Diatraea saccharalis]|uniref:NADH dehydrogenase [ubiquinone] 1 beta subcomplex subunit 4 n=1 Tax=Diatraea saccharalis TaxID=40085 RepID=A0A9N9R1E6_9NEOP|nr:unnamed protein product [Diatraea saccharalis]